MLKQSVEDPHDRALTIPFDLTSNDDLEVYDHSMHAYEGFHLLFFFLASHLNTAIVSFIHAHTPTLHMHTSLTPPMYKQTYN